MTPQEWIKELAPEVSNRAAQAIIAKFARAHLEHNVTLDDMVSTTTLVDALFPLSLAKQSEEGMAARDRMFQALSARALGKYDLADCMTRGPQQRLGSSHFKGRPCLWHAPKKLPVCEKCGQPLPALTAA